MNEGRNFNRNLRLEPIEKKTRIGPSSSFRLEANINTSFSFSAGPNPDPSSSSSSRSNPNPNHNPNPKHSSNPKPCPCPNPNPSPNHNPSPSPNLYSNLSSSPNLNTSSSPVPSLGNDKNNIIYEKVDQRTCFADMTSQVCKKCKAIKHIKSFNLKKCIRKKVIREKSM